MKNRLRSLLIGSAIIIAPQIASASLLIGFHDFDGNGDQRIESAHPADVAAGFSGQIFETETSSNLGGSTDVILGDSFYNMGAIALNDGYASIKTSASQGLTMTLTNSTGLSYTLGQLYYDAVGSANSGSKGIDVSYLKSGGVLTALTSDRGMRLITTPEDDYRDYAKNIVNLLDQPVILGADETISFYFSIVGGLAEVRMDNLGIDGVLTAIPEPGSLLALGCVLGSGALLRTRRRTVRLA